MSRHARTDFRVLAIDPISRGFGFALLEGPERLIDWGVAHVRDRDRQETCLKRIIVLQKRYVPQVVVVEHLRKPGARRRERARALIEGIMTLASERRIRVRKVSRKEVLRIFSDTGVSNKYEIAGAISSRFPELAPHLPRRRKPWMSEDDRMSIFDAAAFAITHFSLSRRGEGVGHRISIGGGLQGP